MKKQHFDLGNVVLCDLCNKDYTNSNVSGGFTFGSKAVCPDCEDNFRKLVKECEEDHLITAECPEDKSFADWVRHDLRKGEPGFMTITYL